MGCLKLTYYQEESPLKVLYRADKQEQKPVQRFIRVDPLAEKYAGIAPYTYCLNNPILYIDPTGMAIEYADLYKQDKEGNYLYEAQIRAYEAFAMTEAGQKYITDRAQEGFKLKGVFEKDLNITIDKAGSLDKKGIDVNFTTEILDNSSASGELATDVQDGRLKLSVQIENSKCTGDKKQVFDLAESISHEVFYHGDIYENKFLSLSQEKRSLNNIKTKELSGHKVPIDKTAYYRVGVSHLQQIQKNLGYSKVNTSLYLYYNVILPPIGYYYKLRPDIKE